MKSSYSSSARRLVITSRLHLLIDFFIKALLSLFGCDVNRLASCSRIVVKQSAALLNCSYVEATTAT